jgi:hypothetical protein
VVSIESPLISEHFADYKKKYLKDPGPLKRGVTESRGIRCLKLNLRAPCSWIFHNARVGRIKIILNLWSVFLQISRIFLQHFPVSLLRSSSTCYSERRKTKPT